MIELHLSNKNCNSMYFKLVDLIKIRDFINVKYGFYPTSTRLCRGLKMEYMPNIARTDYMRIAHEL